MSDLLDAAANALGTPTGLIMRSAAARAAANGTSTDDILSAWAGGSPVTAPAAPAPPAASEVEQAPAVEPQTAAVAVLEVPQPPPTPIVVVEEEAPLEPAAIGDRVRTAVRVGAWTGASLGVIGFLIAGAFWAPNASVLPEGGPPVILANPTLVMVGVGLVSLLFGAVVAGLSRAAVSWRDPAMQLTGSRSGTGWIGAGIGLVLGVAAGALLTGVFGTPIEGENLVQLPVLATLAVMVGGGALLGALTAIVPQAFGTPVAVAEGDAEEVAAVRKRLGDAITIPLAGLLLLVFLVLPFAWLLLESNHMASNGAAVIAVITAAGILGFASLAGSRPNMKISFGELMVAVIGVATVLLVLLAVLLFRSEDHSSEEPETRPGVVRVI
ncbi:MAG TPA: hypothetical protein VK990_10085 [Acidimicrobiia bacterium]|nr:hypothetical protein [Acidimicrobiia bacterium]